MKDYKNIGTHPETLDNGRVVGVRGTVPLTESEEGAPMAKRLIEDGTLIPAVGEKQKQKPRSVPALKKKEEASDGV